MPRRTAAKRCGPGSHARGATRFAVCLLFGGGILACVSAPPVLAQSDPPSPGGTADAAAGSDAPAVPGRTLPDPVVGSVEGHPIYLSDLGEAAKTLPDNLRGLPFQTLYPVLLDRMIDHEALVIAAKRQGLEQDKQIQRDIQAATGRILEGAYLGDQAAPQVTETAIHALYDRRYANRQATEEVHARHILVTTEAEARKVLDDLHKGADFATLARVLSKDPDAASGGDLGFFRREQVWPSFADSAFSLRPGEVSPNPVKNEFGWHVIKVEERRLVAPPGYSEVHDQLRQELLAKVVRQVTATAKSQLTIHRFNLDGAEIASDSRLNVTGASDSQTR